jgi:hypothetical protein
MIPGGNIKKRRALFPLSSLPRYFFSYPDCHTSANCVKFAVFCVFYRPVGASRRCSSIGCHLFSLWFFQKPDLSSSSPDSDRGV